MTTEQRTLPLPEPDLPPPSPSEAKKTFANTIAPLWARLMEKLLDPWIEIKLDPAVPPFIADRPICYVIENYGLSNALILDRACREAGLPSPLTACDDANTIVVTGKRRGSLTMSSNSSAIDSAFV